MHGNTEKKIHMLRVPKGKCSNYRDIDNYTHHTHKSHTGGESKLLKCKLGGDLLVAYVHSAK